MTLFTFAAALTGAAGGPHGLRSVGPALQHFAEHVMKVLQPFGAWGLGGLALFDSALLPLPVPLDGIIVGYVEADRSKFLLYSVVAAAFSALGSLLPFYAGRIGGELILLKKINRARYERLRDRFERQEFLAILLPAMGPPPTPIKLFELSAGVFEMKVGTFLLAMFLGKLLQFLFFAVITYIYGPTALHVLTAGIHAHGRLVLYVLGLLLLAVLVWVARKVFSRRGGTRLPIEEEIGGDVVEEAGDD